MDSQGRIAEAFKKNELQPYYFLMNKERDDFFGLEEGVPLPPNFHPYETQETSGESILLHPAEAQIIVPAEESVSPSTSNGNV